MRFFLVFIFLIIISCSNENIIEVYGNKVNPSEIYTSLFEIIPADYSEVFSSGKSLTQNGNKFEDCDFTHNNGNLSFYKDGFIVSYGGECPSKTIKNGRYAFERGQTSGSIQVSGSSWFGNFKLCYNCKSEFQSGKVRGNSLYDSSGYIEIGYYSQNSITTVVGSGRKIKLEFEDINSSNEPLVTEKLKTEGYTVKPNFVSLNGKNIPVWSLFTNPKLIDDYSSSNEKDVFSISISNYEEIENSILVSLRYQQDNGLYVSKRTYYTDSLKVNSIVNLLMIENTDNLFKKDNIKDTIQLGFVYKGFYDLSQVKNYGSNNYLKYWFDIPDDYKKIKSNSQFEILSEYDLSEKIKSDEIIKHVVDNSKYLKEVDGKKNTISVNTSDYTRYTINKPDTVKISEDFKIKFEVPVIDSNGTLIKEKDISLSYKFLLYNSFNIDPPLFTMMMSSDFYREDLIKYTNGKKSNLKGKKFLVVKNELLNFEPSFYKSKNGTIISLPSQLEKLNENEILSNKYSKNSIPVLEKETLVEVLSEENTNFYKIKHEGQIVYLRSIMYRDKLIKF